MTAKQNVALFFEDGFVVTKEEQRIHDELVVKAQRETRRFIARLVISMNKKFATIKRNKLLNEEN